MDIGGLNGYCGIEWLLREGMDEALIDSFNQGHKIRKLRFALRIRGWLNDIAFWPYAG
jgi:hypothetical protein